MATEEKPLSTLVSQGWEVVSYAFGHDPSEGGMHCVLLRKQKQHRFLQIRKRWMGKGYVTKELDV